MPLGPLWKSGPLHLYRWRHRGRAAPDAGATVEERPFRAASAFTPTGALAPAKSKLYDAFNFSANFFSSFAIFGEITNMQYGCREFSL
jgi:hypothetical protein